MASLVEAFMERLGMRPPPPPKPVPDLLAEGEFGPPEGQPPAVTGVATFDVMGLGLVDDQLLAAKSRIVANLRKIQGEAVRARQFAQAIESVYGSIQAQSVRGAPVELPPEPDPVPRQVVLENLQALERREEEHKRTFGQKMHAQALAKQEQSIAIAKAGGMPAYLQQQAAIRRQAEAAAKEKAEWTALAAAGDPAGKTWVEWQKALQATKHADTMLRGQQIYGKTPEARAQIPQLQAAYNQAKALSDAWAKQFQEVKRKRDLWIAKQELASGTHKLQTTIAELEAKRAASRTSPPTYHFTVNDNVALINARKQLEQLLQQVATATGTA